MDGKSKRNKNFNLINKKLRFIKTKNHINFSPLFWGGKFQTCMCIIVDCIDGVVNATQIYCWSNVIYVTDPSIRSVTAKLGGFKFVYMLNYMCLFVTRKHV